MPSTAEDVRWPEFCRSCVEHGILSTLSLPLTVDGVTNGALNLYTAGDDDEGGDRVVLARLHARLALAELRAAVVSAAVLVL